MSVSCTDTKDSEGIFVSPDETASETGEPRRAYQATPEDFKLKVMVHDVVKVVAEEFDLTFAQLQAKGNRSISRVRHIATYLAKQWTTFSYPYIGFNTGRRDHTSAMYSYGVIREELQSSSGSELMDTMDRIKARLDAKHAAKLESRSRV
jgi:chromosomal replication initiation ATPase DnaA